MEGSIKTKPQGAGRNGAAIGRIVPLAKVRTAVARGIEHMRVGGLGRVKLTIVGKVGATAIVAQRSGRTTSKQGGPRRRAHRIIAIRTGKTCAFTGKPVHPRRRHRTTLRTKRIPAHLIRKNENDMGLIHDKISGRPTWFGLCRR